MDRTLGRSGIEKRLDTLIRRSGEDAVNRLCDEVRVLGPALGLYEEAAALDALIGVMLGTHEAELLAPSPVARRQGQPCDPDRLALFQILHAAVRDHPPISRIAPARRPDGRATLTFFEACSSTFIEVTGRCVVVNLRAGLSDPRFLRHTGFRSVVYGVTPHGMEGADEYASVEDLVAVFAVCTLSELDYLRRE